MTVSRVLVTGATGFIGSHCLRPLVETGWEVYAVARSASARAVDGVTWIEADLLRPGAGAIVMERVRPELLLHLAWYVDPGTVIEHEENLVWLSASVDLLRQFRAHGGRRCVFSGSCYEYDWRYGYCSEDLTPACPGTLYGAAKKGLSDAMLAYCRAAGLSGAWARLFFLYGPNEHERRLVPAVTLSMLRGEPAKSSHGRQVRDYMHVQDAADGLVALLKSEQRGIYNIASGSVTSVGAIVRQIADIVGRPDLLEIGALPARANDMPVVVADVGKTQREVGWQATIDLASGLSMTVDWWRNRVREGRARA